MNNTNNAATLSDMLNAQRARAENGNWVPASGGTETPFAARSGRVLLYVWQPSTGNHAYLDVASDLILSDAEAMRELAS